MAKIEAIAGTTDLRKQESLQEHILNQGAPPLTLAQLEDYLRQHHRDAQSLLAASRLTQDLGVLREAAHRYPEDPQVHFQLALRSDNPAEKQHAIEELSRTDPTNALGPYLAASQAFAAGDSSEAVRQLTTAAERATINAYDQASMQADEQAYLAAGFKPLEAKTAAVFGHATDHDQQLNVLYEQMLSLGDSYDKVGDPSSSLAVAEQGIDLARKMQSAPGQPASGELIGISTEKRFLEKLDPASVLTDDNITVKQRWDQLAARRDLIQSTMRGVDMADPSITPLMMNQYLERLKLEGEVQARQWLRNQLGLPTPVQ